MQWFLLLNVFLIGVLSAIAVRHAYAHFRPPKEPEKPPLPPAAQVHLPSSVKENLIHEAEANFLAVMNGAVGELQHDLRATAVQLNKQLEQLGSEIAVTEKGRYTTMLEELRKETQAAISAAQAEISQHQSELKTRLEEEEKTLKAKLAEDVAAERERVIKQIDTKLGDAVGSFLTETLGRNVDLGAQEAYLLAQLEEHKDDFKREVGSESEASK